MRTIRLTLGYIGTAYEGWQSQRKKHPAIQEIFEQILSKILNEKIDVAGCSRTDSGVHACEFVAHFKTSARLADDKMVDALNFYLPKDIVVYKARTVKKSFHARFSAKAKVYEYRIWNSRIRPLFEAPFVYWQPIPLDIRSMRSASECLVGRHDFAAFMDSAAKEEIKDSIREIFSLKIRQKKQLIRIRIEGNGFLRYMVRVIAGTLMEAGRGKMAPGDVDKILKSKKRTLAGPTLPAQGLSLVRVRY